MNVAVLGAAGFIGGHTVRVLKKFGDDVRAVVRTRRCPDDSDEYVADARDVYALREAFTGCDYVVHAALGSPDVIVGSIAPVYAAAQAVGVRRIVYISTGSVHGQSPAPGTDEQTPLTVCQPFAYNTAKVRAERKLRKMRARGTVEAVVLRPTIVFGPGSRWVRDFACALGTKTAYVVDGARGICNSIYVDNLVHAIRLALETPGVDGEVFLVGDTETVTWRDLYRPICESLGFDLEAVPSFPPPKETPGVKQLYLQPIRSSELGQALLSRLPDGLKGAIRRAVRFARPRPANPASGGPTRGFNSAPVISAEIAALHCCRWRLPCDKSLRILGYVPPVSFREGCRRSVDWLNAAMARNVPDWTGSLQP